MASGSTGVQNIEKQMKTRGHRMSAFTVLVYLEPLMSHEARVFLFFLFCFVFYMISQKKVVNRVHSIKITDLFFTGKYAKPLPTSGNS